MRSIIPVLALLVCPIGCVLAALGLRPANRKAKMLARAGSALPAETSLDSSKESDQPRCC